MTLSDALILGVIQGITEFLPISSQGHLILTETFLKLDVESLKSFDVAIHFGTLLAIFVYFWQDVLQLIRAFFLCVFHIVTRSSYKAISDNQKLSEQYIWYLLIATCPTLLIGFLFNDWIDNNFRKSFFVAIMLIIVSIFFFFAEYMYKKSKAARLTPFKAFMIGIAQTFALIPGVSRSGATIATSITQGIRRDEAARFSFLLGSIAISAATVLSIYKIAKGEFVLPAADILLIGILSAFLSGLLSISFLMKFLKKHTLYSFAIYRIIIGLVILYLGFVKILP